MKTRFENILDKLRSSFWVVPASLVGVGILAALVLVQLDSIESAGAIERAPWIGGLTPEGSRALLSVVATSVLALAGVTFSVTIVALTLASSQFGPRILRNFIRSRANQTSLGLLLATHTYALIALTSVRTGDNPFTPRMATNGAILLALVSLAVFIYFIHHVVTSIQAERVVAEVHRELCESIERLSDAERAPTDSDEEKRAEEKDGWPETDGEIDVCSGCSGYVQAIDIERLVRIAREHDLRCRVLARPGDHVVRGQALMALEGGERPDDEICEALLSCMITGAQRTAEQDIEYCARQLVEVALRALSPGINDPFTAMNCIDALGDALVHVASKRMPESQFRDSEGALRARVRPQTFRGILDAACDQIRQNATDKPDVSIRLLTMLRVVASQCQTSAQREAVAEQADLMAAVANAEARTDHDARAIRERHEAVKRITG